MSERWHRWRPRFRRFGIGTGASVLLLALAWHAFKPALIDPRRFLHPDDTLTVVDRNGIPLRHTRPDGYDRRWVRLDDVSPHLIDALLSAEDRRYHEHAGVDWRATGRALLYAISPFSPRTGASTITQQTVKLVYGRPFGRASKPFEILRALRLEEVMTKDEILEQYLNRVPFGDQIVGVARASEAYFGKSPAELSVSEAALLAGIPQAPSITEPRRHLSRALSRRRAVLDRMREDGRIDRETHRAALASRPLVIQGHTRPWRAPRFVDRVVDAFRRGALPAEALIGPRAVRTSIDWTLQSELAELMERSVERFSDRGVENGAAIVLHNETGEILAYVGAATRGPDVAGGYLDLLRAARQPGSTLKPFVYELLFEHGGTAATVLDDIRWTMTGHDGALFEAEDYDGRERGPVRARDALAGSLNLAALDASQRVGSTRVVRRLRALHLTSIEDESELGAGVVLGGADVRPIDLATAYLCLARGGRFVLPRMTPHAARPEGEALMQPGAAAIVRDILRDGRARERAFGGTLEELAGGPFALKTGTSSGWRDAWAAAFDDYTTVVVWLGDPSGRALRGLAGFEGAAPVAARALAIARPIAEPLTQKAHKLDTELAEALVCPLSGARPGPSCPSSVAERFVAGSEPTHECPFHRQGGSVELPARYARWLEATRLAGASIERGLHDPLRIVAPRDGARLLVDPRRRADVGLVAQRGELLADARWFVDGEQVDGARWALREGTHRIRAEAGSDNHEIEIVVATP